MAHLIARIVARNVVRVCLVLAAAQTAAVLLEKAVIRDRGYA